MTFDGKLGNDYLFHTQLCVFESNWMNSRIKQATPHLFIIYPKTLASMKLWLVSQFAIASSSTDGIVQDLW